MVFVDVWLLYLIICLIFPEVMLLDNNASI